MAFVQLRQPRRAGGARQLRLLDLDAVRRADLRHAGARAGALLAWPRSRAASACRSAPAAACAPRRFRTRRRRSSRRNTLLPTCLARRQLRAAHGRLARGRPRHGLREVRHGRRPGRHDAHAARGRGPVAERPGARCDARGRARASISSAAPTPRRISRTRSTAHRSPTTTASSSGRPRAPPTWPSAPTRCGRSSSPSTCAPPIDPAIDEALLDYMARRKAAFPDSNV